MSDFMTNGAAVLPDVKTDLRSPTGAATEWDASDANDLRQAALDLRTEAISESSARAAGDVASSGLVTAEAALRVAADSAIIASGAQPANVGLAPVTPTGSVITKSVKDWMSRFDPDGGPIPVIATGTTQAVTVADRAAREVWLEDFGEAGSGDWTAILNAALAYLRAHGGGMLRLKARTYLLLGKIRQPWDAVPPGSIGQAAAIRIVGQGRYFSQYNRLSYDTGTFLDMRYDAATTRYGAARWEGDAAGVISFEHVNFVDKGGSPNSTTFFITSYTAMKFNDCSIVGDLHDGFPDAIRLGGNNGTATPSQDILFGYQAYGSQVRNCFFDQIGRACYFGLYCNQAIFDGNLVWQTCSGTAILESDSTLASGVVDNSNSGIQITNNYIELVNHDYAIKITTKGVGHYIANNGFYDIGVGRQPTSVYYVGPNCTGIFILSTGPLGGLTNPLITGAGAFDGSTTLISSQVNQDTYFPSNVKMIGEFKVLNTAPALILQDLVSSIGIHQLANPATGVLDMNYLPTPSSGPEAMFQFHRQSSVSRRLLVRGAGPHTIVSEGDIRHTVPDANYLHLGTESHLNTIFIGDQTVGFFGYGPVGRQTVSGKVASATTVADLVTSLGTILAALRNYGLVNDTTT